MRICVVGTGRWGLNHVRTLAGLGVLAAVVDASHEQGGKVAAEFGVTYHPTLSKALQAGYDAWVVAVPSPFHLKVARPLLEAGQRVLVEKPLALSVDECEAMEKAAKKGGGSLMVGHLLQFHPAYQCIRDTIAKGRIGRVHYIYSHRLNLGTVRTGEDVFWSFTPHDLYLFEYLTGEAVETILAQGGEHLRKDIIDQGIINLTLTGGVRGHIFASWLHPYKDHRLVVVGEQGMLVYVDSSPDKRIELHAKGFRIKGDQSERFDDGVEILNYTPGAPLQRELQHFILHLSDGIFAPADEAQGKRVVHMLEAVTQSAKQGKIVNL